MKPEQIFSRLQKALQTSGEFDHFSLVFWMANRTKPTSLVISTALPGRMQVTHFASQISQGNDAMGIVGVPTRAAIARGQEPYLDQFVNDSWVTAELQGILQKELFLINRNPPRLPAAATSAKPKKGSLVFGSNR